MSPKTAGSVWMGLFLLALLQVWTVSGQTRQRFSSASSTGGTRGQIQAGLGGIRVIGTYPHNGTIVKKGNEVRLSCRTSTKWFFCVWKGPRGDTQCAIQENSPRNVCTPDKRIALEGGTFNCDILIKDVQPNDYGNWNCLVNDFESFNSDSTQISLEVGVEAVLEFRPGFGATNELTITDGQTATIRCAALGAHPIPILSWEKPADAILDTSAAPEITQNNKLHTADVYHVVTYKARLEDDGKELRCISTQYDKGPGVVDSVRPRPVLYEKAISVKLKVNKAVLPPDGALTQRIGIITGVVLAVIFLLLCLVFLCLALCKRKRRRGGRRKPGEHSPSRPGSSSQATDDTSPDDASLKPIWTTTDNRLDHQGHTHNHGQKHKGYNHSSHHQNHHNQHRFDDLEASNRLREPFQQRAPVPGDRGRPTANAMRPTISNTTVSTGGSSWEEDRSVGGEIEDVAVSVPYNSRNSQRDHHHQPNLNQYYQGPRVPAFTAHSPGLETHFDDVRDSEFPRTVYHLPHSQQHLSGGDPQGAGTFSRRPGWHHLQPPSSTSNNLNNGGNHQRPSSSTELNSPMPSSSLFFRPTSSLGGQQDPYWTLNSSGGGRRAPTPNDQLNTSIKSVFDCDLGCFVDKVISEEIITETTKTMSSTVTSNMAPDPQDPAGGHHHNLTVKRLVPAESEAFLKTSEMMNI